MGADRGARVHAQRQPGDGRPSCRPGQLSASLVRAGRLRLDIEQYPEFPRAFWQVDLGVQSQIAAVRLWDRAACCGDRPAQGILYVTDTPITLDSFVPDSNSLKDETIAGQLLIPPDGAVAPYTFEVNAQGRFVTLSWNRGGALRLAEVEVLGYPLENAPETQIISSTVCGNALQWHYAALSIPFR